MIGNRGRVGGVVVMMLVEVDRKIRIVRLLRKWWGKGVMRIEDLLDWGKRMEIEEFGREVVKREMNGSRRGNGVGVEWVLVGGGGCKG